MPVKHMLKSLRTICIKSLNAAAKEQGLAGLADKLKKIVPDIKEQYSTFKIDNAYLETKARCQHAFQISLVNRIIPELKDPVIVDIGDSAGTHLKYIKGLYPKSSIRCLSVNLDPMAVKKIKENGLEAIHARAEDLSQYNINADIFLCFQTLEHLMNPVHFLHELSSKTKAKYMIITIPYLKRSRVSLNHIRFNLKENITAERTHIFEFSPEDWKLLVQHSGWAIVEDKIYLQYPRRSLLRFSKLLWKRLDFEGFYGMILKRDDTWSSKYLDW